MYKRYHHTAVGSITLSDSMTGLFSAHVITPDVWEAIVRTPFRFHPTADRVFYDDIYWRVPHSQRVMAGKTLLDRFDKWYKHRASDMEKVHIAVAALTDSDESIGLIIDEVATALANQQTSTQGDCTPDWSYQLEYDAALVKSALSSEKVQWWCKQFENQAQRVLCAPRVDSGEFLKWTAERHREQQRVARYIRQNPFLANDVSVRRGRKILKRSMELFSAWFDEARLMAFIRGNPLRIRGHHFEWVLHLEPYHFITKTVKPSTAHVPYDLYLYDFEGQLLAKACIVFHEAAVLDQAVALAVHVSVPDCELDLLTSTNVFGVTDAGYNDKLLCSVKQLSRPEPISEQDVFIVDSQTPWTVEVTNDESNDAPVGELDQNTIHNYREMLRRRRNNKVANLIRDELFSRLDIRTDVLQYMACPECPMYFVGHLKAAPKMLKDFIEHKLPLGFPW